ncbi:MAG: transporter [SAR324 cluster bacterium]|uniref:Transporter n=1 Tax=SAR324 cluster bacterium TaxID=2024889 RepID=A0A7X9FT79_9DELT|nr:transporter [SAR324 cluster bacterium]
MNTNKIEENGHRELKVLASNLLGDYSRSMRKLTIIISLFLSGFLIQPHRAFSCDYCGIYTPISAREFNTGSWNFGISETLLGFAKIREDGSSIPKNQNQNLKTNVTELSSSYDFSRRFSLQAIVPFVDQEFTRLKNGSPDDGSEFGLGDVALYGQATAIQAIRGRIGVIWQFVIGVKLPTGDSSALKDEDEPEFAESAIHPHDIALGSGSADVPFATVLALSLNSWRFEGGLQYNLRTEGDESYQYSNDFRWNAGAAYVWDTQFGSIQPKFTMSGLTKSRDEYKGMDVKDSGLSEFLIGPAVEAQIGSRLKAELLVQVPVWFDNNGLQALQDHLVRIGLSYRL